MSPDLVMHIRCPAAVAISTRDASLQPHLTRGLGFREGPGEDEATVYLPARGTERLLADLKDNGRIAVSVGNVANFVTRQLKGQLVRIAEPDEAEMAPLDSQHAKAIEIIGQFFGPGAADAWKAIPSRPAIAVTFRVESVFDQTPKAGAGGRIQ